MSSSPPFSVLTSLERTLGTDLVQRIQQSNLLLVGAGGIGCECLKNMALSGFSKVTIVDLDTIDVSNLNRQLLFRARHVGKPKCTTAAEVATEMASPQTTNQGKVEYTSLYANVCDTGTFDVAFLKQFDLVVNALDNLTARRRINRLCLAAQVPLVEAGTTGYKGQAEVICPGGESACYECKTHETPKVFPVCTIRATPSQPVHTIVWAKEFWKLLLADKVSESMLHEDVAALEGEKSMYMESVEQVRELLHSDNKENGDKSETTTERETELHARVGRLLENLYRDEIQKQLDLDRYKTAPKTPLPLNKGACMEPKADEAPTLQKEYGTMNVSCWTVAGCVAELQSVLKSALQAEDKFPPAFDKDHDEAMRFVTAASNLRNLVFQIELQSFYKAKGIAGNIITAIATTNAMAAGLQILQVYNVLAVQMKNQKAKEQDGDNAKLASIADACRYCQILRLESARTGIILTAVKLDPPNPNCFVCRQGMVEVSLNTNVWTLEHFIARILQTELGLQDPSLEVDGDLIWEQGPGSDQDIYQVNATKTLSKLPAGGIHQGTAVRVDDFSQQLELTLHVSHVESFPPLKEGEAGTTAEELPFLLKGATKKVAPAAAAVTNGEKKGDDDDKVIILTNNKPNKRKTGDEGKEMNGDKKRRKVEEKATSKPGHDVISIDD